MNNLHAIQMALDPKYYRDPDPRYPGYGPHYLSGWYEYNEGHHIMLARTLPALDRMLWVATNKHEPDRFDDILRINIVAPPVGLVVATRRLNLATDIRMLKSQLKMMIDEAGETEEVRYCTDYKAPPPDPEDPVTADDEKIMLKWHSGCGNCDGEQVLVSDEVLLRALPRYLTPSPRNPRARPMPRSVKLSPEAPTPDSAKPLLVVLDRGGHHAPGTTWEEIENVDKGSERLKSFHDHRIGFYFQVNDVVSKPDAQIAHVADIRAARKQHEEERIARIRAREAERPAQARRELEELLKK